MASLLKDGFLKEYLEANQKELKGEVAPRDQAHEIPVHGELNTILGGFSKGRSSTSKRKRYARAVMTVEARRPDHPPKPAHCFTSSDLEDVVPHEDDLVVISVVTVGRKLHRVLIDHGSSTDVMIWSTFNSLQLSPDQLKSYDGCLFGFAGDQVEVQGYIELRTTFFYGTSARTINVRYIVVNASSTYNLLLGRPSLNRLGAVASTRHMKMRLPSLDGGVITIKYDQKTTRKCYESSLKSKRGTYSIIVQAGEPEEIVDVGVANERQPGPAGEVQEKEIGGKKFKLGTLICQELQGKITEVILKHMDAFAWSFADMTEIDPDILCHRLTMHEKVRLVV